MGESQTESGKMCISGSEFGYFIRNEIFLGDSLPLFRSTKPFYITFIHLRKILLSHKGRNFTIDGKKIFISEGLKSVKNVIIGKFKSTSSPNKNMRRKNVINEFN
jgi:hypothetical protein